MKEFIDYYALLGISIDATTEKIETAYRHKISQAHPDKHGGCARAEEAAKQLNMARSVLKDCSSRAEYDKKWRMREMRERTHAARSSASRAASGQRPVRRHPHGSHRGQRTPKARQPPPSTSPSSGAGLFGLGVILAGALLFANKNTYDADVDRYRGRDGRFRSGLFF